jgi:hypothetical protein
MRHGITAQEWIEYLGGTLPEQAAARIRSHVEGCAECAQLVQEQLLWHNRLTRESARMRWALELPEQEMARLLESTLAKVQELEAPADSVTRKRSTLDSMLLMQSLMEPIFGAGTARMAMDLAVRRSTHGNFDSGNWPLFVTNLSEAVAAVCGSAAARLVNCAGACLAVGAE